MRNQLLLWTIWLCCGMCSGPARAEDGPRPPDPSVLARALAGPLSQVEQIVFAVRLGYEDPHWYANIGYFCDDENKKAYPGGGQPDVGRLCLLDIRSRHVTVLFDAQGGSIRDPDVHYDARKVVFSYRQAGLDNYHLYEINLDGTGLRPLTSGPFDDYEPTYLPDGGLMFVSTRCQCWVNCWMTQVGVLYRCDADGSNIRRISHNAEHDNTPAVLPDGKILYTRWEYVDRSQVEFHHLWTINPDGSGEMVYYGNMHPGMVMIDARPIPNSRKVMVNFSPGHGVTDHQGHVAIVSPAEGPDRQPTSRQITNAWPLFKDPYPLSEDCFVVAQENKVLVMDGAGQTELLYQEPQPGLVHEPRPVIVRPRERQVASRIHAEQPTGRLVLADVYQGRNMEGVQRGDIRKLLVLELLPKQVNFSGGPDLTSWLGTFSLERVLGTVPVEEDGSACFDVPACRPVFFVALDANDMSVQRMHSFVSVMPGETTSCVGCHEPRSQSPSSPSGPLLQALQRPPSTIQPFAGLPDVVDFPRDIQPILDRHCVECHNYQRRDGGVLLTGDLGLQWSHSFFHLFAHLQVGDGRNGLGNYPPRSIGSAASPLLQKLDKSHYDVQVTPQEWRTVWMWIESGAPYAGSYAGLRNADDQALDTRSAGRVLWESAAILKQRCGECHALGQPQNETGRAIPFNPLIGCNPRGLKRAMGYFERVVLENDPQTKFSPHILVNMTRPEYSPLLLGPLAKSAGGWESCGPVFADTNDPAYQQMLGSLRRGKAEGDVRPRYGTPGFRPNRQYVRELKRYGILASDLDPNTSPIDIFQADRDYWKSSWYTPSEE
ncbi:MAG: HzsA-related protein [Pirellulaceae bacterium]